jgi:hypothetical protein
MYILNGLPLLKRLIFYRQTLFCWNEISHYVKYCKLSLFVQITHLAGLIIMILYITFNIDVHCPLLLMLFKT